LFLLIDKRVHLPYSVEEHIDQPAYYRYVVCGATLQGRAVSYDILTRSTLTIKANEMHYFSNLFDKVL